MQVDEQGAFSTEDVAAFTAAADSLFTAGNVLDRYGDRAALRTQSAVFEVISSFSTLFSSVAASAASFAASARRSQSHRSRWLEKQREEFTAVETILLTAVAMCEWDGVDLLTTLISVEQVALLAHSSTLPRLPSAVYIDPFSMQTVCDAIASCTHIQDGSMDCVIEGSGSVFCHPGVSASALQNNVITVTFISSGGESIRGLQSDDITVWITSADGLTVGAVSGAVKLINNSVSFGYGVDDDWVGEWIEVTVSVMNNLMSFQRRVPVCICVPISV